MTTLFSSRWHRVAALRPKLAPQARVRRQQVRGETWIVLGLPDGGRDVRLNDAAWRLAGRMDGTATRCQRELKRVVMSARGRACAGRQRRDA